MNIFMFKSIIATLVLTAAVLQVLSMAQLKGRVHLVNLTSSQLRAFHKGEGDVVLVLVLVTAFICITQMRIIPQNPRVVLHALFSTSGVLAMLLKFGAARLFRPYLRYASPLGATIFLSILGGFLTSALWYFIAVW